MALRSLLTTLALGSSLLLGSSALAYDVYRYGVDQALKWGDNHLGTPGGVVTWSLVPDGTPFDPLIASHGWSGSSDLASVFAQVGGEAAALDAIRAGFAAWEAVADVEFVEISEVGGLAVGAADQAGAVVGHIRIGAFAFAPGDFAGAVGYAPPPNGGTTLEGDVVFNASNRFGLPAGAEGDPFDLYPPPSFFYLNDFAGLFAHELGHALGLAHSDVPASLMCGYVDLAFDGSACHWADPDGDLHAPITRRPKPDDVAGVQALYGVPEPGLAPMGFAGALGLAALARRRARSSHGPPIGTLIRPSRV
ncbi:MAG: matrixin family metalloprotease [Myxococcota bacterium]